MWYYIIGDERHGPVSASDIEVLLGKQEIDAKTYVWAKGFDNWKALGDVDNFAKALLEVPPPHPSSTPALVASEDTPQVSALPVIEVRNSEQPLAGPWARFIARTLDLWLTAVLLFFAVGLFAVLYAPWLLVWLETVDQTALGLAVLPVTQLVLALVMAVFGTTIGKALLGIHVRNLSGANGLKFNLAREMNVWVQGFALGIPLIALVTYYFQHKRVSAGLPTSYDDGRARVEGGKVSFVRWLAALALTIGTIAGIVALVADSEDDERKVDLSQSWTNPITNKVASFSQTWVPTPIEAESGELFYFVSDHLLAEALFGVEEINSQLAVLDYAEALERALQDDIALVGQWSSVNVQGLYAMRKNGALASDPNYRVQVTITLNDGRAWRTIVFARGRELTDRHFENFVNAAISTI